MLAYELRYLLMRVTRLIVALLCEASLVFLTIVAAATVLYIPFGGIMHFLFGEPINMKFYCEMVVAGVLVWPVGFALWGISVAAGTPYRYKTTMPGVELVTCGKCEHRIPNVYHCPECGAFRWETACFSLVWGLSACVTAAWVVHDVTFGLMALKGK